MGKRFWKGRPGVILFLRKIKFPGRDKPGTIMINFCLFHEWY